MNSNPLTSKPDGFCENCITYPAEVWWGGTMSSFEIARKPHHCKGWCEPCAIEAQLEYAEKIAATIPQLRARYEQLRKERGAI